MVAWLRKVRLVARLQHVDDVASLLLLYLEGDALGLYMKMKEKDQKDISLIEARLKEAFTDCAFMACRKLAMVRWAGELICQQNQAVGWIGWVRGSWIGEVHEAGFHHRFP